MPNMKIYVSGWYEYQIDNPGALVDASKYTPEELDPTGARGLYGVPSSAWEDIGIALMTEVSKRATQNPAPPPPGVTMVNQHIRWSPAPIPPEAL
jgi:hypothetical protein